MGALLLIVIAGFLRLAVSQSNRRTLAPAVAVVIAALVILAALTLRWPQIFDFAGHGLQQGAK